MGSYRISYFGWIYKECSNSFFGLVTCGYGCSHSCFSFGSFFYFGDGWGLFICSVLWGIKRKMMVDIDYFVRRKINSIYGRVES